MAKKISETTQPQLSAGTISMIDAVESLSRAERFYGVTATMNTLLIEKGIYTQEEFDRVFIQWAKTHAQKKCEPNI